MIAARVGMARNGATGVNYSLEIRVEVLAPKAK
jgi:hypothetical protein